MTTNDIRIAQQAPALLAEFNRAGVLSPADVHVASTLAELVGEDRPENALLVALTVRGLRQGSVCLDLAHLPRSAQDERTQQWAVAPEHWPEVDWREAIALSPLVTTKPAPVVVQGSRVYLSRYWEQETYVLQELLARLPEETADTPAEAAVVLAEYFPDENFVDQRRAAEIATGSSFAIITGGPGSGKTTTVARLIGLLLEKDPATRIGLAAPTGKAAARMVEAIHQATEREDFPERHIGAITAMRATTIHRMLGYSPHRGYRHDGENPVPYDVVIVDETSMVSLDLMTRLLRAVPRSATLIFVGDANQLASVEVGAVFADLIEGLGGHPAAPVAELGASRRFGAAIDTLAGAINAGEADDVVSLIRSVEGAAEPAAVGAVELEELTDLLIPVAHEMYLAATRGDVRLALELLQAQQLLCAHRHGPYGASTWNRRIASALSTRAGVPLDEYFPGQPLLVTRNDHSLGLANGDTGVVVDCDGRLVVVFEGLGAPRIVPLSQLSDVQPAYALTIHKSQGSQFHHVFVLLPDERSRILTRELLYTAVTRAQRSVRISGEDSALRAAVGRRVDRASGLALRLSV